MKDNRDFSSNFYSFFWHFAKKYKFNVIFYAFLVLIFSYTINLFLSPYILKYFVDNIKTMSFEKGLVLLFLASFLALNFLVYAFTEKYYVNGILKTCEDIRIFLFEKLLNQSVDYFNSKQSGDIISKINFIVSNTPRTARTTLIFFRDVIVSFFSFVVFFYYNIFLGFVILILFFLYVFIEFKMLKTYTKKTDVLYEKSDKIIGFLNDVFSAIINVKIFSNFRREKRKVGLLYNDYLRSTKDEFKQLNSMWSVSFLFSFLIFGAVLFTMIYELLKGQISLGSFLFVVEITRHIADIPSNIVYSLQSISSVVSRINNNLSIIRDKINIKDKKDAEKLVVNKGKIVFKGVNFSYDK